MEKIMTLDELSEYLLVPKPTLYRLLTQRKIPAFKVGNQWRFSTELIDNWLKSQITTEKKVLVVDDEAIICLNLEKIIKAEGNNAISAQSGKEALELLNQNDFDLIFLDLALPDISGVDILRTVKQKNPDQPVIIITGFPESELMDQALSLSPLSVIKKPFKKEQIQKLMKRIFSSTSFQT